MNTIIKYPILVVLVLAVCVLEAQNQNRFYLSTSCEAISYIKAKELGWGCALSVGQNYKRFGLSVGYEYFTGYSATPYYPETLYLPSKKWMGVSLTEKYYIKQSDNWHFAIVLRELIAGSRGETVQYYPDADAGEITEVKGKYTIFDWSMSPGCEISRNFNRFGISLFPMVTFPISNPLQGVFLLFAVGFNYSL